MNGTRLFTIPIYVRDPDSHHRNQSLMKSRYIAEVVQPATDEERIEGNIRYDHWFYKPWPYTQMVGAVEITVNQFGDLKAYYWYVDARRVTDSIRKKKFRYAGKLSDVSKLGRPNGRIREDIIRFVENLPKLRTRFKNRYFDAHDLVSLLPAIDFAAIHAPT